MFILEYAAQKEVPLTREQLSVLRRYRSKLTFDKVESHWMDLFSVVFCVSQANHTLLVRVFSYGRFEIEKLPPSPKGSS